MTYRPVIAADNQRSCVGYPQMLHIDPGCRSPEYDPAPRQYPGRCRCNAHAGQDGQKRAAYRSLSTHR